MSTICAELLHEPKVWVDSTLSSNVLHSCRKKKLQNAFCGTVIADFRQLLQFCKV